MTFKRRSTGESGEEIACSYLEREGYKIIYRNYRCSLGEIDIIALDGGVLCFIEVKTRNNDLYGPPYMAITSNKQRQMSLVALEFISKFKEKFSGVRFDVVSVRIKNGRNNLELFKGAFDGSF